MKNHITVRVYANDDFVVNVVREDHLVGHIKYNTTFRPGGALFVDGECINKGYLNSERIEEWKTKISEMNIDSSKCTLEYGTYR